MRSRISRRVLFPQTRLPSQIDSSHILAVDGPQLVGVETSHDLGVLLSRVLKIGDEQATGRTRPGDLVVVDLSNVRPCFSAGGKHIHGFVNWMHLGPARDGDQGRVVDE